jgi:hypothetical protein
MLSPRHTISDLFPLQTQWERSEVSADKYVFQNLGTGQWITVNEANVLHSSIPRTLTHLRAQNHLVTVNGRVNATLFAVESAGEGEFEVSLIILS